MTTTLDAIRSAGETDLESLYQQLDTQHKKILRAAIKRYGIENVPESIWLEMQRNIEEGTMTAVLLLLMMADDWTTEQMVSSGIPRSQITSSQLTDYSLRAARQVTNMAAGTVETIRNRLTRRLQDQALSQQGGVGELTNEGIDAALDDVFTQSRRETIAIDQSTQAMSAGQIGARDRAEGGDGAKTGDGKRTTIALIWKTERDNLVCPRCSPLEGQPEEVWGRVFPNGPGPAAHPRCRCELEVRVVPAVETEN